MEFAHWQFSVEYFASVMRLYYTIDPTKEPASQTSRARLITLVIWSGYISFYSLLVLYYVCWTYYYEKTEAYLWYLLSFVSCLPCTLLLVSINLFRSKIKQTPGFYANERIMQLHAGIFIAYIVLVFAAGIAETIWAKN